MRVILDTNILLSAFFKADSPPNLLIHAWMDGRYNLLSSAKQIEEITRVARYPQVRKLIHSAERGIGEVVVEEHQRSIHAAALMGDSETHRDSDNMQHHGQHNEQRA